MSDDLMLALSLAFVGLSPVVVAVLSLATDRM